MAMHNDIFALIIIIILSLISRSSSIDEEQLDHNYWQEETGYDFQAYPSNIRSHFDYNSTLLERGAYDDGLSRFSRLQSSIKTISVDSFGARGDGSDDSEIYGTVEASDDRSDYSKDGSHWILFDSVESLIVEGGGIINGNGNIWWKNSCKINKALAVTFYKCQDLIVQNIKVQDAQQIHISFEGCANVQASYLVVTAPENSPNTDGIHVTNTQNIQISSCTIGTGDDCISIVSGSQKVQATDIICGPGHGISIGSLGARNSEEYVVNVTVNNAKLSGTTNGVRIKTWQGGSGSASNIKFQNIQMQDVKNPIIVDQNYCDQATPCNEQNSAVQVRNVVYQNIKGTSASDFAINFNCSKSFPCQGIVLRDVDLVEDGGQPAKAFCNNVNLSNIGYVSPHCS
ncbi:hypothetical protein ACH5RR_007318 [Cinchona calisaya]|uniref:Polygalacturonase n=1 Tax=Cinchona calisaya TaxID=153742 RepID=A0ABD3ARF5_9GENT